MNIMFLDIDGVLNYEGYLDSQSDLNEIMRGLDMDHFVKLLAPEKITILNRIVAETRPELDIVISSTWRKYIGIDGVKEALEKAGFEHVDMIVDMTSYSMHSSRGLEIHGYCKTCPELETAIVLDDDPEVLELQGLRPFYDVYRTDYTVGLTDSIANAIIQKIKGDDDAILE